MLTGYLRNEFLRPQLNFNKFDERYKVDRTSCNGVYMVENCIPVCPVNYSSTGRGSLLYWGPNHALILILTSKKESNHHQILIKEIDATSFKLPRVKFKIKNCERNVLVGNFTDFSSLPPEFLSIIWEFWAKNKLATPLTSASWTE